MEKNKDKYSAVWVSHSSMGDFLKCPRLYYLHNVYKDPKTGRKMNIVNPALSLGQAVHEVLEGLIRFKAEERMEQPLLEHYEDAWGKVSGKKGGFTDKKEEEEMKERGKEMIERVMKNPGPLSNKTVKLKDGGMLPNFYLSEEENIILCGKIDWLEYREEDDSIRVLDFKTGKNEEKEGSLQLPIYFLLLKALQKRPISGAYYWYVDSEDAPREIELPDPQKSKEDVLKVAREVKKAREENEFKCPRGGCFACKPYEKILNGEAEYVGVGEYKQDLYMIH
ncbi:MAG: RecB family exonuclease [Candidatus Paceibacterota bacterium]